MSGLITDEAPQPPGPGFDWPGLSGQAYCLIDAARASDLYAALQALASVERIACLYEGDAAGTLAWVAPYLMALDVEGAGFDWAWNDPERRAGFVFLESDAPFDAVRAHMRRLTRVRTEDGTQALFRFYDPVVLEAFLPTCNAAQWAQIFGPITRFLIAAGDLRTRVFSLCDGVLVSGLSEDLATKDLSQ